MLNRGSTLDRPHSEMKQEQCSSASPATATPPSLSRLRGREGTAAFEYALIAGLVMLAILVAAAELGRQMDRTWSYAVEDPIPDN